MFSRLRTRKNMGQKRSPNVLNRTPHVEMDDLRTMIPDPHEYETPHCNEGLPRPLVETSTRPQRSLLNQASQV